VNDAVGRRGGDLPAVNVRQLLLLLLLTTVLLKRFLRTFKLLFLLFPRLIVSLLETMLNLLLRRFELLCQRFPVTRQQVLVLLLLLMLGLWLVAAAEALLVDARPGRLEHLAVDDHHDDARQVEGTDGREDCISKVLTQRHISQ